MQVFQNAHDAADFVAVTVAQHGNILAGNDGQFYYVDEVLIIDNTVVVVCDNRFYVLCIKGTQFFVNGEFDEAANDPKFWCDCAA